MCETLGTNWEDTAKQQISLKLEAWEAIARVRELHYREIDTSNYHCAECSDTEYGHYIDYPCNTIKILDGGQ